MPGVYTSRGKEVNIYATSEPATLVLVQTGRKNKPGCYSSTGIDRGQTRVLNRVGGLANPWKRKSNTVPDQFLYIDSIYTRSRSTSVATIIRCSKINITKLKT